MSSIDDIIDRLRRATTDAGMRIPELWQPTPEEELERLRAVVAPCWIPGTLDRLWQRVRLGPANLLDLADVWTADFAAYQYPMAFTPRCLLEIGEHHGRRLIELARGGAADDGAIWSQDEETGLYRQIAPSLVSILELAAECWERGVVRWIEAPPHNPVQWDEPAWELLKVERFGGGRTAGPEPADWLPEWLAFEGLTAADLRLRGATATIGEILAQGPEWPGPATIRARVVALSAFETIGASVADDSGDLTVIVPPAGDRFGQFRIRDWLELDVRPLDPEEPLDPWFERQRIRAVVTAVRRLPG
jgi:hypothetical protein